MLFRSSAFDDSDPRPVGLQADDEGAFQDNLSTVRTRRALPVAARRPAAGAALCLLLDRRLWRGRRAGSAAPAPPPVCLAVAEAMTSLL